MKEKLINNATARLADKKGFSLPVGIECDTYIVMNSKETKFYLRPTQSLLQKWLREKHNLHIELRLNMTGCERDSYFIVIKEIKGNRHTLFSYDDNPYFKLYESALEFALQKALMLIK